MIAPPKGLDWKALPTLEDLQAENPAVKVAELRKALSGVTCYRCADKTLRYDREPAEAAVAAIELAKSDDRVEKVDLLFLFNKTLSILEGVRRDGKDTIKAMQHPLEKGLELIDRGIKMLESLLARIEGRLTKHEDDWDRMVKLTEELITAQHSRELQLRKQSEAEKNRGKMVSVVEQNVPTLLSKWGTTREAGLALEFIGSLDPLIAKAFVDSGVLDEKQTAQATALLGLLEQRKAAKAKAEQAKAGANGAPPPAPPPPPSESAPA